MHVSIIICLLFTETSNGHAFLTDTFLSVGLMFLFQLKVLLLQEVLFHLCPDVIELQMHPLVLSFSANLDHLRLQLRCVCVWDIFHVYVPAKWETLSLFF